MLELTWAKYLYQSNKIKKCFKIHLEYSYKCFINIKHFYKYISIFITLLWTYTIKKSFRLGSFFGWTKFDLFILNLFHFIALTYFIYWSYWKPDNSYYNTLLYILHSKSYSVATVSSRWIESRLGRHSNYFCSWRYRINSFTVNFR